MALSAQAVEQRSVYLVPVKALLDTACTALSVLPAEIPTGYTAAVSARAELAYLVGQVLAAETIVVCMVRAAVQRVRAYMERPQHPPDTHMESMLPV